MSAYTTHCPPQDPCGPCGTLPAGFARLRYFYGKRMGVADFLDEQRFHVGKQRFHNQRAHGSGLLCGLRVLADGTFDVVLRVTKGAALDACGREIVVGYDQCIDLAAWFLREQAERRETDSTWPTAALDAAGRLPLTLLIRYRDCSVSPEPAPRDTCSCDAAGCDFGRVQESFELRLVPSADPLAATTHALVPPKVSLEQVLGRAAAAADLGQALADAASVGCPEPDADGWLALAAFDAVLTPNAGSFTLTGLGTINGKAQLLAQTALLQDLLKREISAQLEAGALNDGPEVTGLVLEAEATPSTFYRLYLTLSAPVLAETVPSDAFTLSKLAPSGSASPGWSNVPCQTSYEAATATAPDRLLIRINNASGVLVNDGRYRVALDPNEVRMATPIVDDDMRPLRPLRGVFQFSLAQPATDLVLIEPPYAR